MRSSLNLDPDKNASAPYSVRPRIVLRSYHREASARVMISISLASCNHHTLFPSILARRTKGWSKGFLELLPLANLVPDAAPLAMIISD